MEKDPVLKKYRNEGFGKNAFGWYFNPWIDEYDEDYDPHNDEEYNEELKEKSKVKEEEKIEEQIKWHPKLTHEQIEELIEENIYPGDNEYNMYLWNHGINPTEKIEEKTIEEDLTEVDSEKKEPLRVKPRKIEPEKKEPLKVKPVKKESNMENIDSGRNNRRIRVRIEEYEPVIYPPTEIEKPKGIFGRIFDKIKSATQSHREKAADKKESDKPSLIQRLRSKGREIKENATKFETSGIDGRSGFLEKHKVNPEEQVVEGDEEDKTPVIDKEGFRVAYAKRQQRIKANNKGESR